jgi:hypothetical protein
MYCQVRRWPDDYLETSIACVFTSQLHARSTTPGAQNLLHSSECNACMHTHTLTGAHMQEPATPQPAHGKRASTLTHKARLLVLRVARERGAFSPAPYSSSCCCCCAG